MKISNAEKLESFIKVVNDATGFTQVIYDGECELAKVKGIIARNTAIPRDIWLTFYDTKDLNNLGEPKWFGIIPSMGAVQDDQQFWGLQFKKGLTIRVGADILQEGDITNCRIGILYFPKYEVGYPTHDGDY